MSRRRWVMVSVVGATLTGLLWLAFGSGVFDTAALNRVAFHMAKAKLVGVEITLYGMPPAASPLSTP
ncbi:MAG: hypothetical protein WBM48_05590 [Polyangiales bacterium]|jgi:hypothetical protein